MSDRIAVLHDGRVEQYDTPENIYRRPATAFVAHFVGKSNWLSETELFRPESAGTMPFAGALRYDLPVAGAQYLGDAYEIAVRYHDVTWTLYSQRRPAPGEMLSVYIDPQEILSCTKEKQAS